jgi:hypothetical protein
MLASTLSLSQSPCVAGLRAFVDQRARRGDAHRHVGEHELHALEIGDRLLELLALLRIGDRRVERALREADALRADRRPVQVERAQRGRKPLPSSPTRFSTGTRTLSRKIGVFGAPRQPIFRSWRPNVMPFIFFGSSTKALMPGGAAIAGGARHQHDVLGLDAVAAPLLAAVDDVAVAVLDRARRHRADVGAGLRLGDRDRGDDAALRDLRQEALALLLGAEVQQRHDEHRVEAGDRAAGRRDTRDLFASDAHQGQVAFRAAVALGHPQLHQAHVAVDRQQLGRKAVSLVDLGGDRRDVALDHAADAVAERQLLFGEVHRSLLLGVEVVREAT